MQDMSESLRHYRRAADLLEQKYRSDPENPAARQHLSETLTYVASALLGAGQPDEERGLALAKELADRPDSSADHVYNYAWLAVSVEPADLQDPSGALPHALKAIQMGKGRNVIALHVSAQAYAGTGDFVQAVETEERALALFPPGQPATTLQSTIERALNQYRSGLKQREVKR
jgi:tetratricopeptide (TPR) repeat protein